jgi:apolipoprotein N-acyltransferase
VSERRGPALALAGLSGWRAVAVAALAGVVAGLGQAPFGLWPATPLGLACIAALVALSGTSRAGALRAFAGAAGYFALTLHWIVEPFFVDAARHGWMAPFALVLFAGGLALFWGLAGWGSVRAARTPVLRALLFAPLLTLAEAARGTVLTGFPWAFPGHALIPSPWLMLSALTGAHGLTLLVAGIAAIWAVCLLAPRVWPMGVAALALLFSPFAMPQASAPPPQADAPVIRLIQPNAPQHLKWQPDMIPVFWQRGRDLTARAPDPELGAPDLVVWPETSLPVLLDRSDAARLQLSVASAGAPVLIGAQRVEGFAARNALALVDGGGTLATVYDKHHLVPFGEYLPLRGVADSLGITALAAVLPGGYSAGEGPALLNLGPGLGHAFPMICYEAIFPGYIRRLDTRPDWMVHVTNDAWFGTFSGPWQHLALARLRAAEQGLPVLRAANTGVSAVIDGRGRVLDALPLGEAGFLDARLPPALPPTVYARVGDAPVLLFALVWVGTVALLGRRKKGH